MTKAKVVTVSQLELNNDNSIHTVDLMRNKNSSNENIDAVEWFHSHNCNIGNKTLFFEYISDSGIGVNVYAYCSCGQFKDVTDYDTW